MILSTMAHEGQMSVDRGTRLRRLWQEAPAVQVADADWIAQEEFRLEERKATNFHEFTPQRMCRVKRMTQEAERETCGVVLNAGKQMWEHAPQSISCDGASQRHSLHVLVAKTGVDGVASRPHPIG